MTHRQDVTSISPSYTRHCFETPTVSPCRSCEHRSRDKNEPPCDGCPRLTVFQSRPVNIDIDRAWRPDPNEETEALPPSPITYYRKLPEGATCSVCGREPAHSSHFKDQFNGFLGKRCYHRLQERYRKTGSIYHPKTGEL